MNTKRVVTILVACLLCLSVLLTGCGGKEDDTPTNGLTGQVIEASFTRNEDGTCTDKATGTVFLDDDLDNWDKIYERGANLKFDPSQPDFFGGDDSRAIKTVRSAEDAWFTYKLDGGVKEVGVITYTSVVNGKWYQGFTLQVSPDNQTWTTVEATRDADVNMGSNWHICSFRFLNIDPSNKYVKIVYDKCVNDKDAVYNPNIGRVRLNHLDGMNDADRYLENRASAIFYVDSKNGSDKNDGMSPDTAFKSLAKVSTKYYQPGDQILFKAGCTFNGSMEINGYGLADARVTIGSYGEGAKPIISARGGTAVTVACDYVTVENLEITNPKGTKGILIATGGKTGALKGIVVQNNYVHDVNVDASKFSYEDSGICAMGGGSAPTWYEDMVIQNNTVKNTARTGIYCTTSWGDRYEFGWGQSADLYVNDDEGWWPQKNLKILNNTVDSPQGDAILVISALDTVIERNVVTNAFAYKKSFLNPTACAGVWTINTNNTRMQYNDVGYTSLPLARGGRDGEGFDIDMAEKGTIVQYNYSHNNEGGFLLLCDNETGRTKLSRDHIVRFNLSVNDATRKDGQGVFMIAGSHANTHIYNNTIIAPDDGRNLMYVTSTVQNFTFENNIFYGNAKLANGKFTNVKFINNILAGGAVEPKMAGVTVSGNQTVDPKFKNAGLTKYDDRAAMIAAYTPTAKLTGASVIENNGGKDINGTDIGSATFYGCVKY